MPEQPMPTTGHEDVTEGYSADTVRRLNARSQYIAKLERDWGRPTAKTWEDDFDAGWLSRDEEVKGLRTENEKRERQLAAKDAEIRPEVRLFALAMESELRQNDHKGGWKDCDQEYLVTRIRQEWSEVVESLKFQDGDQLLSECADVANFLMMLCDVRGVLVETPTHLPSLTDQLAAKDANIERLRGALEKIIYVNGHDEKQPKGKGTFIVHYYDGDGQSRCQEIAEEALSGLRAAVTGEEGE